MNENLETEFEQITKPLIKWLNENGHPHMQIVVTPVGAQWFEGLKGFETMEFVKD